MNADGFRKLALEVPNSIESDHGGHPDFRVGGKVFASLGAPDEEWGMVKLTPEQQRTFLEEETDAFSPCRGAWGERGYTNVLLAAAKVGVLRSALTLASQNVLRPAPRRSRRTQ